MFFFLTTILLAPRAAHAQVPSLINFQAKLGESSSGPASATFSIYDSLEGGTKLWEEIHSILDMDEGYISVLLGSNTPFPSTLFSDSGARFIELVVNGETLTPRLQLTSVSYALRAQTADQLLSPVVTSLNGVSDALILEAGDNIEVEQSGQTIQISAIIPDGSFSLNELSGNVILEGGNNIEVVQSGQTITINSNQPGEEGGINVINAGNGISVSDTNGPTTTISLLKDSISDAEIKDNSITGTSIAPGTAVLSLNGISDEIIITGGDNVDIDQSGQTIVVNAEGVSDGVGIATINGGAGISVSDTDGPTTTISIQNNSISDAQIADKSISQSSLASGAAVYDINGISNQVTLAGGDNVDIVQSGQTLTINASTGGGGGGVQSIAGGTGISVANSGGPTATVSIENDAINDAQIADNSLTANSLAPGSVGSSELSNQLVLGSDGKLEIQNPSGQIRAALSTSNGGGFLGLDTSGDNDAVTLEALGGNAYGLVTVHNLSGDAGVRVWGDQTAGDLAGGALAVFKRNGDNSSTWIRTGGSSGASWGIIGVSDANNNEVIRLDGQNGDVSISGNLSKGSGSFKIDHPLDPENKYLSHSFVESPDMMNIYNGNVVLDNEGAAWVELPEWFEALNKEFRYQLTCIGGFAQVYIAEEIAGGRFKIAGGSPGLKVSWQVTGVRQDPFAELHRIEVEEDKPAERRGTYLHPDAYGQ